MSGQRATDLMLPARRDTFCFFAKRPARAPAQDGTPFYREQTLRIVISTGVAGGFEACARLLTETSAARLGAGKGLRNNQRTGQPRRVLPEGRAAPETRRF